MRGATRPLRSQTGCGHRHDSFPVDVAATLRAVLEQPDRKAKIEEHRAKIRANFEAFKEKFQ